MHATWVARTLDFLFLFFFHISKIDVERNIYVIGRKMTEIVENFSSFLDIYT